MREEPVVDMVERARAWVEDVGHELHVEDLEAVLARRFALEGPDLWDALQLADELRMLAPNGAAAPRPARGSVAWLEDADALLREPDPGPTPFAIEGLVAEGAIAAIQGPEKVGKTWVVLELALALTTGRDAFGRFGVPAPGPVILVLEESGRTALHRRLDQLVRGYAIDDLGGRLLFAANRRVRLNDGEWQVRLREAGELVRPRAIILDPLARLKGSSVDENVQREIGPVLDYLRDLRDATGAAVLFVHHTGHEGTRLRGSSDLEAYWESKIVVKRDDGTCELSAEHREAEATPPFRYRLAFDPTSRSLRLAPVERDDGKPVDQYARIRADVETYLRKHPKASANEVNKNVEGERHQILRAVRDVRAALTVETTLPLQDVPSDAPTRFGSPENHPEPPPPAPTSHVVPADGSPPLRGEPPRTTADGAGSTEEGTDLEWW